MRSIDDLAKAIVRGLRERSFANEVQISELSIPGDSELQLRVAVFDVADDSVDGVESELYDLLFDLEEMGYPGRGLVSVYRREESDFARRLPPAPIQGYRPGAVEVVGSATKIASTTSGP